MFNQERAFNWWSMSQMKKNNDMDQAYLTLCYVPPLERRLANHSPALASFNKGPTITQLCSIDSNAIVSDFLHFQAGLWISNYMLCLRHVQL